MITKTKYPGICNNCGRKCEYQIRCGIHTIMLCGTCLQKLKAEATTLLASAEDQRNTEYNNSVETGLIKYRCMAGMTCTAEIRKVPPTGGIV